MEHDPLVRPAAVFLAQALGLGTDPVELAAELAALRRDATGATYTVSLDSSVGPAAFLVYAFDLGAAGGDGRTGRERFEEGLATLTGAAERDAPGPRILAHLLSEAAAFILATSPATYRALTGGGAPVAGSVPLDDPAAARREAAGELLRLLRAADAQASRWLAAIGAEGRLPAGTDPEMIAFDDVEAELALFLLDEGSVRDLLRVLNLMIAAARGSAGAALGGTPEGGPP